MRDFFLLLPYCCDELRHSLTERLRIQPKPQSLAGREVPHSLNEVSYGMLDELRSLSASTKTGDDASCAAAVGCVKTIVGIDDTSVMYEDVNDVFGFLCFVQRELERINELFKGIQQTFSPDEIAAGIKELDFGSFGVLDWYARRMGIANQNEVRRIAWVRIFQCMKNDIMKQEFERRLQRQYERRNKVRKGR